MKTYRLIALLALWLGLALPLRAQYHFRAIDTRHGLPDNYVSSLLKDRDGFMWIATLGGLARYDGYTCRQYDIRSPHDGRPDLSVRRLEQDQSGQLWITTYNGLLYTYDRQRDCVTAAAAARLKRLGISVGRDFHVDIDAERNLWCVSGRRLTYYRFADRRRHTLTLPETAAQVACRGSRAYALSPRGTLYRLDPTSGASRRVATLPSAGAGMMTMYIDTRGQLWLFGNYVLGVYRVKPDDALHAQAGVERVSDQNVLAMAEDGEGNLWWATNSDGLTVHRADGTVGHVTHSEADAFSLPTNHVSALLVDGGLLWVGTSKVGAAVTRLGGARFSVVDAPTSEDVGFLAQDSRGRLWIGFDGSGLALADGEARVQHIYNVENSALESDLVIGGRLSADGNMYLGTFGGGIYRMDAAGRIERLLRDRPELNYVRRVIADARGNLWIGSQRTGLWVQTADGRLLNYNYRNSALRTDVVTDMAYDPRQGRLYVATSTGLYIVGRDGKPRAVESPDEPRDFFSHVTVQSVALDGRGLLWMVTSGGLRVYDRSFRLVRTFGRQEGLDRVYALTPDRQGNMWLATSDALVCMAVTTGEKGGWNFRLRRFTAADGLGDVRFSKKAMYCTTGGEVLAGADGRIVRIMPSALFGDVPPARVVFTGLSVGNAEVAPGTPGRHILDRNIAIADRVTLAYDDDITLAVSCLDYSCAAPARFAYRLADGGEWIAMDGNRLSIAHLSPGRYTLQVRTVGGTDDAASTARLAIVVTPPFYLSPWAWTLYAVVAIGVAWGALVAVRRRQREKVALQQMLREREYRQQMDEAKMRFLTNIGHDIRTPLSLIIAPIEQLMGDERFAAARKQLDMVYRNAQSLLGDVNQLIDFRRLDNNMEKLELAAGDVGQFLTETCSPYLYMASKKGVTLRLSGCGEGVERTFDHAKLKRVVVNLLSNAIKYTPQGGSVTLAMKAEADCVVVTVADTGVGIRDKKRAFERFYQEHTDDGTAYTGSGIGLHIVKEYVALMHGEVAVSDNSPQGTVFRLVIPMARPKAKAEEMTADGEARRTLLVVEDNADFREFLTDCLRPQYRVATAANGREALEWLAGHDADMVVTDVMMPEMDGMELCRAIKTNVAYSHMPVVMLTAKTADEHVLSGYQEGADDYITKPFNIEILKARLSKLFEWMKKAQAKFSQPDVQTSEVIVSRVDGELIDRATHIVEQHLADEAFTVEAFGDAMCMSRSALYKKLMAISGRSPLEFMRVIRLRHGLTLIRRGGMTVGEVAARVGMSPKQFARFFKEEYGCLPSKYGENGAGAAQR